ncbi:MAG: preprotein translocase subunit YajC [Chloroflexi bacterium ADurb.Bin222]|nr:MAG: preprotein translocase subunit YajC [Chloroflexi bacterium ADurb.Bin222]
MGTGSGDMTIWILLLGGSMLFLFLPQWLARRKESKKIATLEVGQRVMTIGGFVGQLTKVDRDHNMARLRLGEGIEVDILLNAIARSLPETFAWEEEGNSSPEE